MQQCPRVPIFKAGSPTYFLSFYNLVRYENGGKDTIFKHRVEDEPFFCL